MGNIGDQLCFQPFITKAFINSSIQPVATVSYTHLDVYKRQVQGSIEAFVDMDLKKSRYVIDSDDIVDNAFNEIKENLADQIYGKKLDARTGLDILMTAKYFERIGDHAVNIAEWVEFAITGEHRNNEHEYDFEKEMAAFIK